MGESLNHSDLSALTVFSSRSVLPSEFAQVVHALLCFCTETSEHSNRTAFGSSRHQSPFLIHLSLPQNFSHSKKYTTNERKFNRQDLM
jgi:hypothetical protein